MIDLKEKHLAMVRAILQEWLPGVEVRAFGSRVTGKSKPYSDLDLAIISDEKIPSRTMAHLSADFTDSDLPFRVDITERRKIKDFEIEPTEVIWGR